MSRFGECGVSEHLADSSAVVDSGSLTTREAEPRRRGGLLRSSCLTWHLFAPRYGSADGEQAVFIVAFLLSVINRKIKRLPKHSCH